MKSRSASACNPRDLLLRERPLISIEKKRERERECEREAVRHKGKEKYEKIIGRTERKKRRMKGWKEKER